MTQRKHQACAAASLIRYTARFGPDIEVVSRENQGGADKNEGVERFSIDGHAHDGDQRQTQEIHWDNKGRRGDRQRVCDTKMGQKSCASDQDQPWCAV